VIAGVYRGRTLRVPRGSVTRPTAARAREALFNVLGDVSGASVLDLYAGSGALGFEALSRGAARAVFVERDRAALGCIRDNADALGEHERSVVVPLALPRGLGAAVPHGPFDLVFCDPPWADLDSACTTLASLVRKSGLNDGARVVLEHSAKDEVPSVSGLAVVDERTWGDTAVLFLSPAACKE
jgi:16S rRNA (guanine966-N2)-methyltransferase